ncbi:MAG: putative drug resistance permease, major facilitator superfamily, Bcr/CflA subfamily [Chlamydiales bacterium]|jgi:Bcr/CflA subfamily drug resistance transporter|nr:putative drug resistance permease, major facilitator superfamily, Bcr/CflA subfamily [Chlamydiales bacterium]
MTAVQISATLLIALVGLPQISETIYTPALPDVAQGLNTSASLVEASLAIYFLGFAAGVALWGAVSDAIGRRSAMLSGLMIYALSTAVCGFSMHIESLLLARFLQAFGASVGSVITQTILRDAYDGKQRARLFSVMSGALAFSPAIGPLLGGFLSQYGGWRANFAFLFLLSLIMLAWSYLALPETRPAHLKRPSVKQVKALFQQMVSSKMLFGHILLIASANSIIFGFYQEAPFVFIEQLEMAPSHYGLLGLLIALASLIAARISYQLNLNSNPEKVIVLGAICSILGSIAFALQVGSNLFTGHLGSLSFALLALFFVFLGIGLVIPNSLSIALKPYQAAVGTAGSLFGGIYYLLIAASTWLMSGLHNGTASPLSFYIMALSALLYVGSQLIRKEADQQKTPCI